MPQSPSLCKSHPDFHLPAGLEVGPGFDGERYARRMKESGADVVAFFAKCHYGHSYYETEVGTRHPGLKKDMLREVVDGARKHDLGVVAYYSVFLDTAAVRQHPEWRLQPSKGGSEAGGGGRNFEPVCVNSGYVEKLLLPQCREIVTSYEVDELLLDTMSTFRPCYCPNCCELFGDDIPESAEDPRWLDYVRWYADSYEHFFAGTAAELHEAAPGVGVIFNWKWGIREPTPPPPHIARLIADDRATGKRASIHCRCFAGGALPYDYMTGRFLHGLGGWTSNTPQSLKYTAAGAIANGGAFWIIDRQLPDGSLEERAWDAMEEVFGWVQKRRSCVSGARPVPEIGVLCTWSHVMGPDLRYFPEPDQRKERMQANEGAATMLIENGRHFTVINAEAARQRAGEYGLIVAPELEFLDAETTAALKEFVKDGGALLITQSASPDGLSEALLDLAGVTVDGFTEPEYGYFGTEPPLHLRAPLARALPRDGTEVLLDHLAPLEMGPGEPRFGHGLAPPGEETGFAAVTAREAGEGKVIYVAGPVFKAALRWPDPHVAELLLSMIDGLLPKPLVRVSTPAPVEVSVMQRKSDLLVHLVNHGGRQKLGNYYWPVTEYIPPVRDIRVAIRQSASAAEVLLLPEGRRLSWMQKDGYMELVAPRLDIMTSLRVPGYFATAEAQTEGGKGV